MTKVIFVPSEKFTAKERAAGSSYENAFDDTMRRTPEETQAVVAHRRARAKLIKADNLARGKL